MVPLESAGSVSTGFPLAELSAGRRKSQLGQLGAKLLPRLRTAGQELSLGLDASFSVRAQDVQHIETEIREALRDLGLDGLIRIDKS